MLNFKLALTLMFSFSNFIKTIRDNLILFDASGRYHVIELTNYTKLPGWVKISHIMLMIHWKSCNFSKKVGTLKFLK